MASPDCSEARLADPGLAAKYRALGQRLRDLGEVLIGFSGGADSTLLLAATRHFLGRDRVTACLALGPSLPQSERREAEALASLLDVELRAYAATEFDNPAYVANGPDRCFHCKADLFAHLERFAAEARAAGRDPTLLYGGNLDDTHDYRPGRTAAAAAGALAPLAEAGLTKAEVRALSRAFGLPTADKPAQPCLSSRIPYGSAVTKEKLAAVEAGEKLLAALGFREFRLRHHGGTARIEVPSDQMGLLTEEAKAELASGLKEIGFVTMIIEPNGLRSGRLNAALSETQRKRFTEAPGVHK